MNEPKTESTFIDEKNKNQEQKKKRIKYSNWFVTVNPNIVMDVGDKRYKKYYETFKKTLDAIFDKKKIHNFIEIKNTTDKFDDQYIKNINVHYTTEFGEKNRNLHGHAMIEIKHYTLLRLNYEKIRKTVKAILVKENYMKDNNEIHLDVQTYRNQRTLHDLVLDYMKKNSKD
jgi:hypothetical protein